MPCSPSLIPPDVWACQVLSPVYWPGQKVWLSAKDLPLQVVSRKLGPCYLGPFEVDQIALRLKLPAAVKVHLKFHVLRVNLVWESKLPPPPLRTIDGGPAFTNRRILDSGVEGGSPWRTGKDMVQTSDRGFPVDTSWIWNTCGRSIGLTRTSPVRRQEAPVKERGTTTNKRNRLGRQVEFCFRTLSVFFPFFFQLTLATHRCSRSNTPVAH